MPCSRSSLARRSSLALLSIGLAVGCKDSPTELSRTDVPPAFGTVGKGSVKGGGADNANNQGSAPSTSFPPSDPVSGVGWTPAPGYGARLGSPCETDGLCLNGDLPFSFGTLPHPDNPPLGSQDRFAIMSTADFICPDGFENCPPLGDPDVQITVRSTAIRSPVFTVPVGDYRLEFLWALLANPADVDNFGRVTLLDLTDNTTQELVNLASGDIGDAGKPAARPGGCGSQVIGNDLTGSFEEDYDLCTDWQTFSTSLAGRTGHDLQLLFEVTEVGNDNLATTFAFEDVDLAAAPTAAEGAVEQVEGPPINASDSYDWSIETGCSVTGGSAATQTVSFTCTDNGTFELFLITTNQFGSVLSDDTSEVTITNVPPTVNPIGVPGQISPNNPFTATASLTDPGSDDTHTGLWAWGDGTTDPATLVSGTFANSHTYAQPGNYTISLTVTDDDGGQGSSQRNVSVQPTVLAAAIDIRPGTSTNVINLRLLPAIPVALWGSASFNVANVPTSSLRFGPGSAPALLGALRVDLNRDGFKDLLAAFGTRRSGIQVGQTSACLTGTIGGQPFQGCDAITVIAGP